MAIRTDTLDQPAPAAEEAQQEPLVVQDDFSSAVPLSYHEILRKEGVYRTPAGHLMRRVEQPHGVEHDADGNTYVVYYEASRPVALTLEEARARQMDYFSEALGWIRYGTKREREHPDNFGTAPQHKIIRRLLGPTQK